MQEIEQAPRFAFNARMKITSEKERQDAATFIGYLKGFEHIAEKTLTMDRKAHKPLNDTQGDFLHHCIAANKSMQFKVDNNRHAVYKQMSSLFSTPPKSNVRVLSFWETLLKKNKINQELFDEQFEQIKTLYAFFNILKEEGFICQSPRTVQGKIVYKAAL